MNAINTTNVTDEQIARCHRILDGATGQPFYLVENEAGNVDDEGHVIEYKVTYNPATHNFSCGCACGQGGFASVHNASGYCKHVRWALAAAREDKKEILASRVAETNDVMATIEFQSEYREYLQEQEDIKAGYEQFDSCVPQA